MFFKTTIYTVPTRVFPFKLNGAKAGTINKTSAPLSIIRSPHIDKKSREQFKFFMQKKTQIVRDAKKLKLATQFATLLYKMYAPVRIKITISYYQQYYSTF